jgi:hypothetical protein
MQKLAVSFVALLGMASAALAQPTVLSDQQLDVVSAGWGSTFQLNFNDTHQRATAVAVSGANVAVIPILSATAQGNATAANSNQTIQVNHN